jgi:hypothetical protein
MDYKKFLSPQNYWGYIRNKIITFSSPFIKKWEKRYYKKYGKQPLKHQPVFIIGAPRTGSTILYQTITNQLDVLYIDNLTCAFNKNLFFGFWLSDKIFKQKAHNCFKSNHGNTRECGLHAPSECGSFWYRWLPKDKHFIDYDDINEKMVKEIREEITTTINYFDKPIVFKNLNAGQRMRLLKKCFPNAKFIFVKRDVIYTAQSILKAKRKLILKDNEFWSIMPKNVDELKQLNAYEQIVKQIYFLEKQIFEDKELFNSGNFLIVDYYELNDYKKLIQKLQKFIGIGMRDEFNNPEINLTEKFTLSTFEIDELKKEIEKLDWSFYDK